MLQEHKTVYCSALHIHLLYEFVINLQKLLFYCNHLDPTNAVIYDRDWLRGALDVRGMSIVRAVAPSVRGFHTWVGIARKEAGMAEIELPPDLAPAVRRPSPLLRVGAEHFGLEDGHFTAPVSIAIRAELPAPDPLAIELRHAKEYIASLERELGRNQPS